MNIVLKLSKLCNLRCSYCYEYPQLGDSARMALGELRRLFVHLAEHFGPMERPPELRFALHGGEPLLLPGDYLRGLVEAQQATLGAAGLRWRNDLQTNLVRVDDAKLALLADLDIGVSVSLDVLGGQRVNAKGQDMEARARANYDRLLAEGWAPRLGLGGICVLHAGNAAQAPDIWRYFAQRGMAMRLLPIFSMQDPPARMRDLMLTPAQIVDAMWAVMQARLSDGAGLGSAVYPLDDYLRAALLAHTGHRVSMHNPAHGEWALIVDTDGTVYTHSDAYMPGAALGNGFEQPVTALLASAVRADLVAARQRRGAACSACPHGGACNGLPMMEAVPSERVRDASGQPACAVARPLIDRMRALLDAFPAAATEALARRAASLKAA